MSHPAYVLDPFDTSTRDPEPALKQRILTGASFLDFSNRQISQEDILLGNRYLCRGAGLFIVAPSGMGKSVLTAQAAIELAAGRSSFGIKTRGPLRSLVIQAEDDEGDIIEMSQIIDHLKLTEVERERVGKNTHAEFVNDLTGAKFLSALDGFLSQWPADIVWINPYTAYLGADNKDDAANSEFLRNGLNPILTRHRCAAVPVHHTPKTNFRDTTNWKPSDWMYSGAGAAVLTNWARAYIAIDPTSTSGVFKFIAAKREKRIGWDSFVKHFSHSRENGQLLWVPSTKDEVASAKKIEWIPDDLLTLIPKLDPILQSELYLKASAKGVGENKVRKFINVLVHESKVFIHRIPRKNAKAANGYAQSPEVDEETILRTLES